MVRTIRITEQGRSSIYPVFNQAIIRSVDNIKNFTALRCIFIQINSANSFNICAKPRVFRPVLVCKY